MRSWRHETFPIETLLCPAYAQLPGGNSSVLGAISIIFITLMERYFFSVEGWQLVSRGKGGALLQEPLQQHDIFALKQLITTLAFTYDAYLVVTDRNGAILADSGLIRTSG